MYMGTYSNKAENGRGVLIQEWALTQEWALSRDIIRYVTALHRYWLDYE